MYLKSKTYPVILAVSCLLKDRVVRLAEWGLGVLAGVLVWDLVALAWVLA